MLRVFLTHTPEMRAGYYAEAPLRALREVAEVRLHEGAAPLAGAALAEAAAGCQCIVADRATAGTAETFAQAPELLAFLRVAVDISTIQVPAASAAGVLVTQATPGFVDSVAELAFGMMIDLARGVSDLAGAYRAGNPPPSRMGTQLSGKVLGLVGWGRIARRVAAIAPAFGMRVLAHDPHNPPTGPQAEPASLEQVLARADFLLPLAVSVPETRHLINAQAFARMKPGAFLVNLSRGELVDEAALAAALDSGRLRGAAMDVGSAPDQRPDPALAARPDVVATPHIGGLTPEAAEHQAMDTVRQVAAIARGEMPEGAVNAEAAQRLRDWWRRGAAG